MRQMKVGGTYQELCNSKIIHVHPNRTSPIILPGSKKFIFLAQTPETEITPQFLFIADEIQDMA
jgi:hypothetical protein